MDILRMDTDGYFTDGYGVLSRVRGSPSNGSMGMVQFRWIICKSVISKVS